MNILALDLGTTTGYALRRAGVTTSGSVRMVPRKLEGPGHRWMRFRAFLFEHFEKADIGAIYFEQVMAHGPGVQAAHIYGGFIAHLEAVAAARNIPLHGVMVGTLKKHWTGKGNALKPHMIAECKRRGFAPVDDNEADAIALLDYALNDQGEHTATPIEQVAQAPLVLATKGLIGWADPFKVPA